MLLTKTATRNSTKQTKQIMGCKLLNIEITHNKNFQTFSMFYYLPFWVPEFEPLPFVYFYLLTGGSHLICKSKSCFAHFLQLTQSKSKAQ